MTTLLAIDGSIRCIGAALFRDGVLMWTGHAKWGKRSTKTNPGERAATLAREMRPPIDWDSENLDAVAYEWPQAYGDEKDPNHLFGILAVSGHLAEHVRADGIVRSYLPREWTGQIPKAMKGDPLKSARGVKIWARLDEAERRVASAAVTHDEVDAIGIGLHHLGRGLLKRQRVYPGAT